MLEPVEEHGRRVSRTVHLSAPVGRVWEALTEGRQLSAWFGAEVRADPRPGGVVAFRWPDGRERQATVEEVAPSRALSFRWAPFERMADGRPHMVPPSRVEFSLQELVRGTLLTVTEEVLGRRPTASLPAR
jgi:uncharacterized protein YndB with AHSA1/START domain